MRAEGIDNAAGKQKIVVELYDKFFRNAFPKMTERLGIVYTPVEVVDFIIHSVDDLLQKEFGQSLGSEGVHIIDPFTGTGTFITRLLQSGLISKEQLAHKYKNEIHANEIILLAYYIAAINIEAVYHSLVGGKYQPFEGICLTDTFQLYEKGDLISDLLVDNSDRRKRQKDLDIRVIMGNPPYSAGQVNANDNNQNVAYKNLDNRIRDTYAADSIAINKNALYDSYIRAIRWASDRLCKNRFNSKVNYNSNPCRDKCQCNGVLGFVTNAGFLEANTTDGLRKHLAEEFSSIYVFHLRGNQRTAGELSRKEAGKIFGSGSRAPIAISLFVKNPEAKQHGQIYWHDIGDYLSREKKLEIIKEFNNVNGISAIGGWEQIIPDEYNDWINQRDDSFYEFIIIGDKKGYKSEAIFSMHSTGLQTNRDAWVSNYSAETLINNIRSMVDFYNNELRKYEDICTKLTKDEWPNIDEIVSHDDTKISWSSSLKSKFSRKQKAEFDKHHIVNSIYRPFSKQKVYFDGMFNHRVSKMPNIFPNNNLNNRVIYLSGSGNSGKEFSVLIVDCIPDLNMQHSGGQGFPLHLYENDKVKSDDWFSNAKEKSSTVSYTRKDGISDVALTNYQATYPKETISREDIFY